MDWFRRLLPGLAEETQPAQDPQPARQQAPPARQALTPESLAGRATPFPQPAAVAQETPSPASKFWWWRAKAYADNGSPLGVIRGNKRLRTPPASERVGKRRKVEPDAAPGQDDIGALANPDEALPSIERDDALFPNSTIERVKVGKQNFFALYPTTLQGQPLQRLSRAASASADANPASAAIAASKRLVAALNLEQQVGLATPDTEQGDNEDKDDDKHDDDNDDEQRKRAQYRDGGDADIYQKELNDKDVKVEPPDVAAKDNGTIQTAATPKSNAGRREKDPELIPRRKSRGYAPLTPEELAALRDIREAEVAEQIAEGWSTPDVALFRKLNMRSLEPLLQSHLFTDLGRFPEALPSALFTDDDEEAFLKPSGHPRADKSTEFRHVRALQNMVKTGRRVRSCHDAAVMGDTWLGGEHWANYTADMYNRWALADIGLSPLKFRDRQQPQLRTLALVELPRHEELTGPDMTARVEEALLTLEATWLNSGWEAVPPLYALVMHGTSTVIAALASNSPAKDDQQGDDGDEAEAGRRIRPMETIDWADASMDVWNALGVAIVVVHCRDALRAALDEAMPAVAGQEAAAAADDKDDNNNDGQDDDDPDA